MFKFLCAVISIFWAFDVLNLPFMEMFDTTYPINIMAWIAILFVLSTVGELVDKPIINFVSDNQKNEKDNSDEE